MPPGEDYEAWMGLLLLLHPCTLLSERQRVVVNDCSAARIVDEDEDDDEEEEGRTPGFQVLRLAHKLKAGSVVKDYKMHMDKVQYTAWRAVAWLKVAKDLKEPELAAGAVEYIAEMMRSWTKAEFWKRREQHGIAPAKMNEDMRLLKAFAPPSSPINRMYGENGWEDIEAQAVEGPPELLAGLSFMGTHLLK